MKWIERFLASPPMSSTQIENTFGIRVDFAAHEGFGHLFRQGPFPQQEHLTHLIASFSFDVHHTDPRRPRDMRSTQTVLILDIDPTPFVEAKFGAGRMVVQDKVPGTEYGAFYAMRDEGRFRLVWEATRPDWAQPAVVESSREHLLSVLVDQLITQQLIEPVCAALAPFAEGAGVEIRNYSKEWGSPGQRGNIIFKPGLELAMLKAAFRWPEPVVGVSHDTHMSEWSAMPIANAQTPPWRVFLNGWDIDAHLDSWPRGATKDDLPYLRSKLSRLYMLEKSVTLVRSIEIEIPAPRKW